VRALRLIAAIAVLALFGLALAGQTDELRGYRWDVEPGYLVAAGVAALLRGPLVVYPWWRIVRSWGHRLGWWRAVRVYFHSGLARYVPGQWWFVHARAYLAEREGVPVAVTAASTLLETVVVTGAAAGVALLGLARVPGLDAWLSVLLMAGGLAWAAALLAVTESDVPARLWGWAAERLKRGGSSPSRLSWGDAVRAQAGAYGNWLLYGLVAWYALAAVSGGAYVEQAVAVLGIFAASVLGGAVLLFVPQGIAVREGVLVYLLNALIGVPVPEAIVTAALTRLIAMAAEGVWAAGALAIQANKANVEAQSRKDTEDERV
jgi:hypothetical protein